ncbi:hypothetical protein QBC38DRAFT_16574 [Podospora fimiseda]|uniref:Uncharacterized protein n=1 Tax=Podospora fimiseda TaxID=252190 RepID=A0AAN7BJM0_9PEZI|nr:hypothetical protein QBC38DRAFT_16574 [Podospora fimiseda]
MSSQPLLPDPKPFNFPLLSAPGEIRNQIYAALLVSSSPIIISPSHKSPSRQKDQSLRSKLLSIFLVSKQIHLEASSIFYSLNTFVLPADSTRLPHQAQINFLVRWFLDRVGPRNAGFIKSLGLPFPFECLPFNFAGGGKGLLDAVKLRCPGLEKVEMDLGLMNSETVGLRVSGMSEEAEGEVVRLFGVVEERLREQFEGLKEVVVQVGGRQYARQKGMIEWKVGEEEEDYKDRKEFRLPEDLWAHYHPASPLIKREPDAIYRYQVAARLSLENPKPEKELGRRVEFAFCFLFSPRRALRERREEKEWLQIRQEMARRWWDQRMCTCFSGDEVSRPASSRRKRALSVRIKELLQ